MNPELNDRIEVLEDIQNLGPFELSLFERVEDNLAALDNESSKQASALTERSSVKYNRRKQVLHVSGWIDTKAVFFEYKVNLMAKTLMGLVLLVSLKLGDRRLWPVILLMCVFWGFYILYFVGELVLSVGSHKKIRYINWVELNFALGYLLVFAGLLCYSVGLVPAHFLSLFVLPLITFTFCVFFFKESESVFLSQKNIIIVDCVQFLLVSAKLSDPQLMNWNMALVFYISTSVFLCLLGLLLSVILSCALFGFLYRDLPRWKLKSLSWMTFYYLLTGIVYIYMLKGVGEFFDDDNIISREQISTYVAFESKHIEIMCSAAFMMIVFNLGLLVCMLTWRADLLKYLSKVIYPRDLRKEISMRGFKKSFVFRMLKQSAVFFKPDRKCKKKDFQKKEEKVVRFFVIIWGFECLGSCLLDNLRFKCVLKLGWRKGQYLNSGF